MAITPRKRRKGPTREAHSLYGTLCRETIDHIRTCRGWTAKQAAERWGVPISSLKSVLSADVAASAGVLSPILEAEEWDPVMFFLQHQGLAERHFQLDPTGPSQIFERLQTAFPDQRLLERVTDHLERIRKLGCDREIVDVVEHIVRLLEHGTRRRVR